MAVLRQVFATLVVALAFTGCFKIGYQIEIGTPSQSDQDEPSGYYYKAPSYYTR